MEERGLTDEQGIGNGGENVFIANGKQSKGNTGSMRVSLFRINVLYLQEWLFERYISLFLDIESNRSS